MAGSDLLSEADVRKRDPDLVAGPGAVPDEGIGPRPLLEGASQYEYVDILNPLTVEFIGMFGVERPVNSPVTVSSVPGRGVTKSEQDVRMHYGLDLRNPDHQGRANIVNRISIPAGRTARLLGNEAQVVIRQLVNEIMAREGNKILLADLHARSKVEQRIIINRGLVADFMGQSPKTINEQLQQVKEDEHEEQFPGLEDAGRVSDLDQSTAGSSDSATPKPTVRIKSPGPKAK